MGTKFYRINKILFIFLILAGVFIIQPVFVSADNLCWDECPSNGQRDESGNQYRICGNYDADTCLEWSDWQQKDNLCWDECPYQGKQECSDSGGYRVCGNYDDDYCLEWSSKTLCSSGTVCQSGECVVGCTSHFSQKCFDNDIYWYDSCGNKEDKIQECGSDYFTNNYRCQGNLVQRELIKKGCSLNSCYSYSQWENQQDCSINGNACNNGSCINQLVPTVNLKANYSDGPITVPYNSSVVLSWSSSNATSCYASGDWSGTKSTSGSETIYNLTSSKTYTLTCTGGGNSSSDTVYVNIGGNNSPVANAGPDREVYENESIILLGSASDQDGESLNYYWSCTGGTLSNYYILQPYFYAPSVNYDTTYTCTLKVTDSSGQNSTDYVNILVKENNSSVFSISAVASPDAGCAPLSSVDLSVNVFGSPSGNIIYYFDCTNDGNWEKIYTTSSNNYTAYDLCNYSTSGNYTAKVRVERGGFVAEKYIPINANYCSSYYYYYPTVNLKANYSDGPITVPYNSSVVLSWSSSNATSCYASGDWSGTKSTSGSETIYNLTSSKTYTLTCTGGGNSSSDTVYVKIGGSSSSTSLLSVKKLVRNITKGSDLSESVLAEPNDVLAFTIEVSAGSSSLSNVIVKDILPEAIKYRQNSLKIDGSTASGDIFSGLNLGSLYQYQHKIISFEADVSSAENFKFGENQFVNIVTVSSSDLSARDTAGITVSRKAVAGAATEIKTGIANNPFLDFFLFPLLIAAIIVWLFRSHIIRIDEWVNSQKIKYQDYKAKKILNLKIAQIKKQKIN